MPIEQLVQGAAAALSPDFVAKILTAAVGLATGDVREFTVELAADRTPILHKHQVEKGARLPKR